MTALAIVGAGAGIIGWRMTDSEDTGFRRALAILTAIDLFILLWLS